MLDQGAEEVDQVADSFAAAPGPMSHALQLAAREFNGWWLGRVFDQLDDAWLADFKAFGGNLSSVADKLRTAAAAYRDGDDVSGTTFWFLK